MTRKITNHIVPGSSTSELEIHVVDDAGSGGANHAYLIVAPEGSNLRGNPGAARFFEHLAANDGLVDRTLGVLFQQGPIGENGVNGLTHEVLLAIVADRLRCFQSGPYACDDNAEALHLVMGALQRLQRRTKERMARKVEGTEQP